MQDKFYYNNLYLIQDSVLKMIDASATDFYLTGGTALSRIYLNHRYSDDLDFFVNNSRKFYNYIERITKKLKQEFRIL